MSTDVQNNRLTDAADVLRQHGYGHLADTVDDARQELSARTVNLHEDAAVTAYIDTAWAEHCIGFTWDSEERRYGEERMYTEGAHRVLTDLAAGRIALPLQGDIVYAVALEGHPTVPVYRRRSREDAHRFTETPPLGEKRNGWVVIRRFEQTPQPWVLDGPLEAAR